MSEDNDEELTKLEKFMIEFWCREIFGDQYIFEEEIRRKPAEDLT